MEGLSLSMESPDSILGVERAREHKFESSTQGMSIYGMCYTGRYVAIQEDMYVRYV